jgi:hypothetical protein
MELMHNATFRILKSATPSIDLKPGIYRVILDEPRLDKTVVALIDREKDVSRRPGGRKKKPNPKRQTQKPPPPLIGEPLWIDRPELQQLYDDRQLHILDIEREAKVRTLVLSPRGEREYTRRKDAMQPFLDLHILRDYLLAHQCIAPLVRDVVAAANVSRGFVYRQWSNLCRHGFESLSLIPRRDRCGAPGVARPCNPSGRKKPGRKTLVQRIAAAYGVTLDPEQPGISSEWTAAIRAADKQIPTPKPAWPKRCELIINSHFISKAKEESGGIVFVAPPIGTYPNNGQIKRALTTDLTRLQRILEKTTKAHFKRALRGLTARNWEGVAGPGHTWAIDSTVGDIYLRSSVNRAWIVGRPIVYIIVDIWSTAVVGFYVCLTGPSWNTAKVSLFNATADPTLLGDLWGYEPIHCLEPAPTMCYSLMCDRGEYLSQGHRTTAIKLIPLTSYASPYRADLKGLVEVLHRIEKDAQFLFIPGAMDYRRQELELRKVNPEDCVLTVREYTQYLYELFVDYNLTADRTHRVDAHMRAAGVFPSPAGLWRWGHAMGVGLRRAIDRSELISALLPGSTARVQRDTLRHAGNDYMSDEIKAEQWTALARNLGGWDVPINHYPGSLSRIWTPNVGSTGLLELRLSDQSRGSPELTVDEWLETEAIRVMQRPGEAHNRLMQSIASLRRATAILESAKQLTADAIARASGMAPSMTEARAMELAAAAGASQSEAKTTEQVRDEAMETHLAMMGALLRESNDMGAAHAAA